MKNPKAYLRLLADLLRRMPLLKRTSFLWGVLRRVYHSALSLGGCGVALKFADCSEVRIPAEFVGVVAWEQYEETALRAFMRFVREYRTVLVFDVGCAIGMYSVAALFASEESSVLAIDADLSSVKACQRVCAFASGQRLQTVYGFASNQETTNCDIDAAVAETQERISNAGVSGDPGTNAYVCIDGQTDSQIPSYTLDSLFYSAAIQTESIIIKCDVEGAEMLVLEGARKLFAEHAPALLLSVHPAMLPTYGTSTAALRAYLHEFDYEIEVLSVDHEEHWWCVSADKKNGRHSYV